ncbi:hypothetical protein ACIHEI_31355 [Kitasatospora sp. NPDC051984]|uniref:hypothetical protein n=1 Tax=Kitasatospora sp. NPDC051984 TaxID=3364059 RepID=UPI0037CA8E91
MHDVLQSLAGNPALLPEHIDTLIAHGDPGVLSALCDQPELTPGQLDALLAAGGREAFLRLITSGAMPRERIPGDDPQALLAAVDRPDMPGDTILRLATCQDADVRRALAQYVLHHYDWNETLTDDRLAAILALTQDPDCSVATPILWVAEDLTEDFGEPHGLHARARTEACARIALASSTGDEPLLRAMLATDGPPALTPCPHHPDPDAALYELRHAAIGNWRAPADAVEHLLDATWPALAAPAAGYWNGLSAETYHRLLALDEPGVTGRVAMNRGGAGRTDPPPLRGGGRPLAQPCPQQHRHHPDRPAGPPGRHRPRRRRPTRRHRRHAGVAGPPRPPGPRAPPRSPHLSRLGRPRPARRPRSLGGLRSHLLLPRPARYREAARRYGPPKYDALAGRSACPPDLLLAIARDPATPLGVALLVAWHDHAPAPALDACLRNHPGPDMDDAVATNPAATPDQLRQVVRSGDPHAVRTAAEHPNLPPDAIDLLLTIALTR